MTDDEQAAFLQGFIDSMPVVTLFVSNDEHYTLKFANQEGARLLGYSVDDFRDNRKYVAASLIHPDDIAVSDEQTERVVVTGRTAISRYRLIAADGSLVPVLDISRAWMENGQARGLITVIVDLRSAPELQGRACLFGDR